jgi:hypothetical protein
MHIFLLLFLFLQITNPQDMMTPQAQLARAEQVIKERQKSAEHAVSEEAKAATLQTTWHQQGVIRNQEKQDLIEKVKVANHLDATWTWDDATSKFVQKK